MRSFVQGEYLHMVEVQLRGSEADSGAAGAVSVLLLDKAAVYMQSSPISSSSEGQHRLTRCVILP